MPEDEYYESIPQKKKTNNPDDDFKNKLMKYVVKRLGEIDEEENR